MKLFVYGTLKGQALRSGGKRATIKGKLYDLGPFPAVMLDGDHTIHGVAFDVTDEQMAGFDRYEGVPHLYTREKTTADISGTSEEVYVYQFASDPSDRGARLLSGGEWEGNQRVI